MDMTSHEFLMKRLPDIYNSDSNRFPEVIKAMEEYASIKTKELEKQLQKEAMKHLSLLDQIKELEDENKSLKELINDIWGITHGFGDNLNDERVEKIYDLIDEKFNQH